MKRIGIFLVVIHLTACIEPEFGFSTEAVRLGELSRQEITAEFERLGQLAGAPGDIPVGSAEVKAGLISLQNIDELPKAQQDLAHALVWAGKDFYRDESAVCDTRHENSTFWLENRFVGAFKYIEKLEGGGAGLVFYDDYSWINDGMPVIAVDYSVITPSMGFMRNEMRISDTDNGDGTSTYLGMMWIKLGAASIPIAYFIPDQVETYTCI